MVKYTEEQLKSMKDMVLTHNHPVNCTFSPEDINLTVFAKLKQLNAVHRAEDGAVYTYTHSLHMIIRKHRIRLRRNWIVSGRVVIRHNS